MGSLNNSQGDMPWLTKKVAYEGFPLLLRKPHHKRFWKYKKNYYYLFCITHSLDKVTNNGLPELEYFRSLEDFDCYLVDLFTPKSEGITLLVETYCGNRNYWFYLKEGIDYLSIFKNLVAEHVDKKLSFTIEEDKNWDFVRNYPLAFRGFTLKTALLVVIIALVVLFVMFYYFQR